MCYGRPIHADMVVVTEFQELIACKLGAIISNYRIGDPKPVNYIHEELYGLFRSDADDGSSLDPFRELVDGHQQVGEAPGAARRGPTRSSPHIAKGHVMGMVCKACAGRWDLRA